MKIDKRDIKKIITIAVTTASFSSLLLAGCSSIKKPEGANEVRIKLTTLQSDAQLASRAPVAINAAEEAVRSAEQPQKDKALAAHLVWMADRKVDIASAQAQSRLLEDQRKNLSEQRQTARLDSRTQEADMAKMDANSARQDTQLARQQTDELQRQIDELNAKTTERGLVVTLGDLLFATGKSELKGGAANHLGKLANFLNKYPERSVIIEGHTDSVGSEDSNFNLSERRANAVKSYLVREGVASNRLEASGKGEGDPVAGNDSATGRQQNRRVEVIIANPQTAAQ